MPSPQPTSEFLLSQLREKALHHFDQSLATKTDCDKLADLIEQRTGKIISVNTLRRFYEVMPSASKPSLETLNILSSFCGYTDFHEFIRSHNGTLSIDNDLKPESINELYAVLGDTPQFFNTLNWLLRLAFKETNIPFLKEFFNLNVFHEKPDYTWNCLKTPLTTFGMFLRSRRDLFEVLTKHYADNPRAQALYFEWFVDYDFLPTRHHLAITRYAQSKQGKEAQLFSLCILFLHAFMLNDRNTCLGLLKKINAIEFNSELHPFPTGRKMACNVLAQAFFIGKVNASLFQDIFDKETRIPRNGSIGRDLPSYQMLLAEAFTWSGSYSEATAISELALKSYETNVTDHTKGILSSLWMYYAQALLKSGRVDEAVETFKKIDTNNFDVQNRNFSLMNYYKIGSQIRQKTNPIESKSLLRSSLGIARSHKFKFFEKLHLQSSR